VLVNNCVVRYAFDNIRILYLKHFQTTTTHLLTNTIPFYADKVAKNADKVFAIKITGYVFCVFFEEYSFMVFIKQGQ